MRRDRRMDRTRELAEIKRIKRERVTVSEATLQAILLIQGSPLENRQNFAVDLFRKDPLFERIETAWQVICGKKREPETVLDKHELEVV